MKPSYVVAKQNRTNPHKYVANTNTNTWQIQIQIQIYGTDTYIFIVSVKVRMKPSSAVAKHKRSIWSQFGAVWRRLA